MIQIVLDFYQKEVDKILDARLQEQDEVEKYNLTLNMLNEYVDTLDLSDGESNKVFNILEDFLFNHLDKFQNLCLGLPNNINLSFEQKKKNAIMFLQKLYGDK